jgi:glutamine amidotransferase
MKVVIVDYGMGNIKSIISSLNFLGVEDIILSSEFEVLNSADKLILPGVGSFGSAILHIRQKNLDKFLNSIVIEKKRPLLGICLGMQLLCTSSTEDGFNLGLGFVEGKVTKFVETENLKIPHVGFNQVHMNIPSKLYSNLDQISDFYFTHSYKMSSNDSRILSSYCSYGQKFISSFEYENIAGVQFHPELSQRNGIRLLNNFINLF